MHTEKNYVGQNKVKKCYVAKNTNDEKSCSKEHIVTNYVLFFFQQKIIQLKTQMKKNMLQKTQMKKQLYNKNTIKKKYVEKTQMKKILYQKTQIKKMMQKT